MTADRLAVLRAADVALTEARNRRDRLRVELRAAERACDEAEERRDAASLAMHGTGGRG